MFLSIQPVTIALSLGYLLELADKTIFLLLYINVISLIESILAILSYRALI